MKKVLIISYYWFPDKGVGHKRWSAFIKYFKRYGYDPIIYTRGKKSSIESINNEYTLIRKKIFDPSLIFSKIFNSNYNRGVVDSSNSIFMNFFSWLRSSFFIPDTRLFWVNPSVNFLKQYIEENKIQIIVTTGPPHSIHMIGYKLKKLLKIKWISDFRDPYTNWDILLNMKPSSISKLRHKKYENLFLQNSDRVVVTNNTLLKEFSDQTLNKKIIYIPNGSELKPLDKKSKNKYFIISYFGLINKFRDPHIFLSVVKKILECNNEFKSKFKMIFSGPINNTTLNFINNVKILSPHFKYYEHIDVLKLTTFISDSSLLLLLLNNTKIQNTTPYKLFDYLVSKKKIITLCDFKNEDVTSFLKYYKQNDIVSYFNAEEIEKQILDSFNSYILDKKIENQMNTSKVKFDSISRKMTNLFDNL